MVVNGIWFGVMTPPVVKKKRLDFARWRRHWTLPNDVAIGFCQMTSPKLCQMTLPFDFARWRRHWTLPDDVAIGLCQMTLPFDFARWRRYWTLPDDVAIGLCQMTSPLDSRWVVESDIFWRVYHMHIRRPLENLIDKKYVVATMKYALSQMIWGAMSCRGAAGLYFIAPTSTVNGL